MSDNQTGADIRDSARDFFADVIHTVCQDILEDLVSDGTCNRQDAENVISGVAKKWLGEGIKIKKRPAPRKPTAKKDKQDYIHIQDTFYYLKDVSLGRGLYPMFDTNLQAFYASYNPKTQEWFYLTDANKRVLRVSELPIAEDH